MSKEAGKGDTPRPLSVMRDKYADSFDRIFGEDTVEEHIKNCPDCREKIGERKISPIVENMEK